MDSLNVINIDLNVKEDSKNVELNVNIDKDFQNFLGAELTKEFSEDSSLQYIASAIGLLLEKYIDKKCMGEIKKPE